MKSIFWKQVNIPNDIIFVLQISLMSSLREDSWILISATAFNPLWCLMFMKKIPHTDSNWKRQEYFNGLLYNDGCSSFIQSQNATNGNSKVSCNVESETVINGTSWLCYTKSTGSYYTLIGSPMHTWFVTSCIGHLEKYWFNELYRPSQGWQISYRMYF